MTRAVGSRSASPFSAGLRLIPQSLRVRPAVAATAVTLLPLLLGILFLGRESFGHDEAASLNIAGSSWSSLWHVIANREANESLYYAILHLWLNIGRGEASVRFLSVLPAALAVLVLYLLGKRLMGSAQALVAACLLSLNGYFLYYAQQARAYSLALLLVTLSSLLFLKGIENPSRRTWVTYVAISALAVYAHFFAAFVIVAHAISLTFAKPGFARRTHAAAVAMLSVSALCLPLVVFAATRNQGQLDSLKRLGPRALIAETAPLAGRSSALAALYVVALAWLLVAARRTGAAAFPGTLDRFRISFLASWLLVPIIGSAIISIFSPVFLSRYLIVSLPPLVLAVAGGLYAIGMPRLALVLGLALFVFSLRSVETLYLHRDNEDWRATTAYLASMSRPSDGLFVYTMPARAPLDVYAEKTDSAMRMPTPLYPAARWGSFSLLGSRVPNYRRLHEVEGRFRRVWLVLSHDTLDETRRGRSRQLQALLANRPRLLERRFYGPLDDIRVRLYGPSGELR
jgi:mannosyltransferase